MPAAASGISARSVRGVNTARYVFSSVFTAYASTSSLVSVNPSGNTGTPNFTSFRIFLSFVNLGNGLSGLVHISQISEKRIKHPSAVLAVGDKVKVKVIAVKDGKLSLSMKALQDVAAQEIEEEVYELPETEEATTTLGSLFANIKLS